MNTLERRLADMISAKSKRLLAWSLSFLAFVNVKTFCLAIRFANETAARVCVICFSRFDSLGSTSCESLLNFRRLGWMCIPWMWPWLFLMSHWVSFVWTVLSKLWIDPVQAVLERVSQLAWAKIDLLWLSGWLTIYLRAVLFCVHRNLKKQQYSLL